MKHVFLNLKRYYCPGTSPMHGTINRTHLVESILVCFLVNGTLALFRPLVPRIVEKEHTRHDKNDL